MSKVLEDEVMEQLFRTARTHVAWLDKPVTDETLRDLYDVMEVGTHERKYEPRPLCSSSAHGRRQERLRAWRWHPATLRRPCSHPLRPSSRMTYGFMRNSPNCSHTTH